MDKRINGKAIKKNLKVFSPFIHLPVYPFIHLSSSLVPELVPHQPAINIKRLAGDVAGFV
jgi:hypothetical protein